MRYLFNILLLTLAIQACQTAGQEKINVNPEGRLFTSMPAGYTGVDFVNQLEYDRDFNIYTYRNFYNGGGVALGDVNRDGLTDIYFTANMEDNRLYLNEGDFRFREVSKEAGVTGKRDWSTGVSMADVNGDGWLDIYVCNSGDIEGDDKENELYINQQDGTFAERAREYGLADRGYSTHAAFFDYDKDGDLDLYLLNNSYQAIGSFNLRKNERPNRDSIGGDKLFRNEGDRFVDVSEEAGIYGSVIGFGLGVTVGDANGDGWQDIYVSNDFFERDYLYLNNQDGAFREVLENRMRSISAASMGADMADINNDTRPDIFVTDMLPDNERRLKTKTTFDNWDRYQYSLENGYWRQFTRNMLHLSNSDGAYSEIGRLAGVEATDWSWGALIADYDNDGWKDLFVANGIHQDLTDQDYIQFISNRETMRAIITKEGVNFKALIDSIPSERVPNYAFRNNGDLTFTNKASEWGLDEPSHSNGAAYGDLDNDGDLDLVINNVNMPAFLYRNEADTLLADNNYLQLELRGQSENPYALGTKITAKADGKSLYLEHMPMRGFQSSMDYRPHLGLGSIEKIDSLILEWPGGKVTVLQNVPANQTLKLSEAEAASEALPAPAMQRAPLFQEATASVKVPFTHRENRFVDFDRDQLLFHMKSTEGPKVAVADVNGNGLSDLYICGAKDQAGKLLLQGTNGSFRPGKQEVFLESQTSEDRDAIFFDADGDGDADLYVASGGNALPRSSPALADRLYLNDGRGNFRRSPQVLPAGRFESTSCVRACDVDGDGDQDLFVGVRLRPRLYGVPVSSYLLENDGDGNFSDVTRKYAPGLVEIGLVTDGRWSDYDGDGDEDLIVAGEWMPIKVFENDGGRLSDRTQQAGLANTNGWWNCLRPADLDGDGDLDFVVGNHGRNSRFRASPEKPVSMYVNDFDQNGAVEQIITVYNGQEAYPLVLRHDLVKQLPKLKKQYLQYENYAGETIEDIFSEQQLENALLLRATVMESSVLRNRGNGTFALEPLPVEAQLAPVYDILIQDFNKDQKPDLLLGGNLHGVKPEVGRYDASYGAVLLGQNDNSFRALPAAASGIRLTGEVRDFDLVRIGGKPHILVARNGEGVQVFVYGNRERIQ